MKQQYDDNAHTDAAEIEWTNQTPVVSGVYWLKVDGEQPQIVAVSGWDISKPEYINYMGPMSGTTSLESDELRGAKWYGPMDAPPEDRDFKKVL